jgi:nicotinamidase-related amidase
MPRTLANAVDSVLIVVDLQPSFLQAIHESERVLQRSEFLVRLAKLLDIPVLATEQYPERMGGTEERILSLLVTQPYAKMSFSCAGCEPFMATVAETGRRQAVLVGIETHICVSQTAHHLLDQGFEVIVAADAISSRSESANAIGFARMASAGAVIAHSESVAYEWMGSAEHPQFREALKLVKEFAGG